MKRINYIPDNDRLVLCIVVVVAIAAAVMLAAVGTGLMNTHTASSGTADGASAYRRRQSAPHHPYSYYATANRPAELFAFDPNTADSSQLLRLGLQDWQVRAIYKYRAAGGIYRRAADFARLYGLTAGQYRALEPYIRISADYRPASESLPLQPSDLHLRDTLRYPLKLKKGEHVALNMADTAMLKRVPGIGSYYAARIVDYRERLGGYHSVSQLAEIAGLPTASMAYFTVAGAPRHSIDINNMSVTQLTRHPYIGFYQARTILEHRRVHGKIRDVDELALYPDFTPEAINRIRPYVKY